MVQEIDMQQKSTIEIIIKDIKRRGIQEKNIDIIEDMKEQTRRAGASKETTKKQTKEEGSHKNITRNQNHIRETDLHPLVPLTTLQALSCQTLEL